MIAGHLQEKNNTYFIVLSYKDALGKRKTKWISTQLPVKGNKKRAEALLYEARQKYSTELETINEPSDMLYSDYLEKWLEIVKGSIKLTTYASYRNMALQIIAPYFRDRNITLARMKPSDIQDFYTEQLKRVKASSVIHYHAVIHKSLKYALKTDLIPSNPADKIERPRKERFTGSAFYDMDEINALIEAVKGTQLELPVLFGAFYGLRRSEVLGLKWDAIDFDNETLIIRHTVTTCNIDHKTVTVVSDSTKTKSSLRTLPLVPMFKEKLIEVKAQQERNKRLCGRCYNTKDKAYICVDCLGNRIRPNYVTEAFPDFLVAHGMRRIRFHDLRHSCASLLLANGVSMKQIQEWLGHSDFSTTANIYAHLDFSSKVNSAAALLSGGISI